MIDFCCSHLDSRNIQTISHCSDPVLGNEFALWPASTPHYSGWRQVCFTLTSTCRYVRHSIAGVHFTYWSHHKLHRNNTIDKVSCNQSVSFTHQRVFDALELEYCLWYVCFLINLLKWTESNDMQLNASKTKEMILGPLAKSNHHFSLQQLAPLTESLPSNYLAFILTPHFLGPPTLTIS